MTIFREEVGAWFLVMFTSLVTGKVWGWIGEGRVEVLEQQPPANPRLFHARLSVSLILSVAYDLWLLVYAVNSVIQQARPNMMVMFLFEFAILATCSTRTALRYVVSLVEANILKKQTHFRLEERQRQVREQRADIMRRRESEDPTEREAAEQEELPDEEIDEMDIEVPGWESKGHWILSLDLMTDFIKLGIYSAFFAILMMFYGLPIHIMRDLFMTARSFVKRLGALMRYRKVLQDMNKYPDATAEDLGREDTCIICREEMRPWDPTANGAVERSRPKKLPCGHILHFGCLKGWLERQQVCPTCRRSVVIDGAIPNGDAAAPGADANGQPQAPGQPHHGNGGANAPPPVQGHGNMRVFQFGPLRLGFAQGNAQNIHEMAERLRNPDFANNPPANHINPAPGPAPAPAPSQVHAPELEGVVGLQHMQNQIHSLSQRVQQEMDTLQASQAELQILYALTTELNRIRQMQQQASNGPMNAPALSLPQHAMPGMTAQVNGSYPPGFPMPHIPQMPQMPAFPHMAPRATPSAVTRHGGASYTNAIPAGSQDLPEGVVIPDGWSLLPLQRLDGQTQQYPQGVQPTPTSQPTEGAGQQPASLSTGGDIEANGSSVPTNPAQSAVQEQAEPASNNRETTGLEGRLPESSGVQREPPDVAAPTPVMPNWGGAAQLFANRDGGASSTAVPSAGASETSKEDVVDRVDNEDGSSSSGSGKGKAKAATVEDGEEE
ncbi:hypothetical protein F5Y15DRAFT_213541 [Xylariaceae sp. FL0016]|nr:hypothetical protein F5Y15DRAFT_213541 [Xylariaceae sp. FL0016]